MSGSASNALAAELVLELVALIAGRIHALVEGLELTELRSRRFDLLYSEEEVAIARKLQKIFTRYEDPYEVIEAVFDAWVGMFMEQLDIDPIEITARVERPWSKWKIAVPLSRRHHGLSFEQSIGGPYDLSWEIRRDGDQDEIWFTGTIEAVSSERALIAFERHLRAFVALSIAARLAWIVAERVPARDAEFGQADFPPITQPLDARTAFLAASTVFAFGKPAAHYDRPDGIPRIDGGEWQRSLDAIFSVIRTREPKELWSGALLLANALSTPTPEEAIAFAVMSLETMLLTASDDETATGSVRADGKQPTTAERLASALRTCIGTDDVQLVGHLCRTRNKYVHYGYATAGPALQETALDLAKKVASAKLAVAASKTG